MSFIVGQLFAIRVCKVEFHCQRAEKLILLILPRSTHYVIPMSTCLVSLLPAKLDVTVVQHERAQLHSSFPHQAA